MRGVRLARSADIPRSASSAAPVKRGTATVWGSLKRDQTTAAFCARGMVHKQKHNRLGENIFHVGDTALSYVEKGDYKDFFLNRSSTALLAGFATFAGPFSASTRALDAFFASLMYF